MRNRFMHFEIIYCLSTIEINVRYNNSIYVIKHMFWCNLPMCQSNTCEKSMKIEMNVVSIASYV